MARRDPNFYTRRFWSITNRARLADPLVLEETGTTVTPDQLASLGLTKRESEVLAWVAQGKTNEAIGGILGCHLRTVKKHLERIYLKLGVENRTAALLATETARTCRGPSNLNI